MKILSKQNFNQNESKNFVVDNLSSAPSNPILGQVYYNTQNERAYVCIKSGETPEWADLSLQEEVSIGREEPNGRDIKIWINPEDMASSSDYGSLPIGSIIPYSGETAPEGYSICDGKELNRETYKELFSIIGTAYGEGDGSTTFNLPNIKGKTVVGLDNSDTDFNEIGKTGGSKYLQEHVHKSLFFQVRDGGSSGNGGGIYENRPMLKGNNASNVTTLWDSTSSGTGDSGNLQPYVVLNYIIKIYGEAMLTGDVIDSLEGDSSYNAPSIHAVNTKIKELEAYSSTAINEGSEITLDPNPNPNYNPIDIQIDGKIEQNGTPTPDEPVEIKSVSGNLTINNSNGTDEQSITIDMQENELCSIDDTNDKLIIDKNGNTSIIKNIIKIDSYKGETISTKYKSTTGELSTGATIYYISDEPQTISLGKITPLKLLEGTNNITTNDELQPNMKIEYYTDVMGNPGVIPDYDGLPVGSEIDFDGTEIPDGFVQVDDPNTYSSEEVVIGTWFGKKLYRKVIVKTITRSGDNIFSLSSVGLENIDKYITLKSISNGDPINEDYYTTKADLLRTLINRDGLHIQLGTSYPSVPCLIYIIVEYTKTTD